MRRFELPEAVRKRLRANGSEAWLASLPELVAGLEREWDISVEGSAFFGGSEALVSPTRMADGTPAILKVLIPREDEVAAHEITAMRLANGEGCARMYRDDPHRGAMLLERLGKPLAESGLPPAERLDVLCGAAMRLWRPAAGAGLPTGAEKGRWLVSYIHETWEELGRPCSERAITHATSAVERRIAAHDDERSVLVHGDIHEWNALESPDGYKLIDPDGLLAEPEYDIGVIAREESAEFIRDSPEGLSGRLAAFTRLDAGAIQDWAAGERLSTALVCTRAGFQPTGRNLLAAAEAAAQVN